MDGSLCDLRGDLIGDGPLVTVVVPVYNTPEGPLRRCLRSILSQDYANIELLVVDDGSNGECVAVLNDALGADPRSRVIGGGHSGVSHARNLGIDAAQGEWVVFCDSDDEVLPSFISDALKVALSLGVEFVCGANTHLYEGDSANPAGFSGRYHAVFEQGQMAAAAKQMLGMVKYAGFDGPDFKGRGPHGRLYNRKALGSLRYDENLAIGEDVLFNYEFIIRCRSLAIVDACWYAYYQYRSSAVHASDLSLWKTSIESTISACTQGEDPAPYCTRCAELTFEAVASFARAEGLLSACGRGKHLLSFVGDLGCFSEECLRGYLPPRSLDIYVRLCRKGLYGAACWFWGLLTLIRDRASKRRLIDPLAV